MFVGGYGVPIIRSPEQERAREDERRQAGCNIAFIRVLTATNLTNMERVPIPVVSRDLMSKWTFIGTLGLLGAPSIQGEWPEISHEYIMSFLEDISATFARRNSEEVDHQDIPVGGCQRIRVMAQTAGEQGHLAQQAIFLADIGSIEAVAPAIEHRLAAGANREALCGDMEAFIQDQRVENNPRPGLRMA